MTTASDAAGGSVPITPAVDPAVDPPAVPIASALLLAGAVLLGDWLFFDRRGGISLAVFLAAIEIAAAAMLRPPLRTSALAALAGLASLAPVVVDATPLSISLAVAGAGAVLVVLTGNWRGTIAARIVSVVEMLARGSLRMPAELPRTTIRLATTVARARGVTRHLVAWIVPVCFTAIFLELFAAANPIIERWLDAIDIAWLLRWASAITTERLLLWATLGWLAWPFAFARPVDLGLAAGVVRAFARGAASNGGLFARAPAELLGEAAILRSLVVFNALFAVQSALDVAILWDGHALPQGMSFAAYAHRGAYPLIVTALIAAAFVLVAIDDSRAGRRAGLVRALVTLFTMQNVVLVASALLRLEHYVSFYALTYWRVAAFVWMVLVAIGLVLILVRIWTKRDNAWLLSANMLTATAALYACAFADLPALITRFNIANCRELTGNGVALDAQYLYSLGPNAFPALDEAVRELESRSTASGLTARLAPLRDALARLALAERNGWRSATLRRVALLAYIEKHTEHPAP